MRQPCEVFTLLETIYQEFDRIAKRRRVFKVETVGDCYVAVCGLPDPRKDHYTAMARFARDCLFAMMSTTKKLEVILGPDTADLYVSFPIPCPVSMAIFPPHLVLIHPLPPSLFSYHLPLQ